MEGDFSNLEKIVGPGSSGISVEKCKSMCAMLLGAAKSEASAQTPGKTIRLYQVLLVLTALGENNAAAKQVLLQGFCSHCSRTKVIMSEEIGATVEYIAEVM